MRAGIAHDIAQSPTVMLNVFQHPSPVTPSGLIWEHGT
ncbi:hypothetical protein EBBID32_32590 [Sphingobium indicum BiD32]|uniref:Uncharacterized protein n=1 Tax=Sphingobium indicum BiD32 TaxID=1301087 RepID=N1MT94_9SPHN|nr:hypothetical protein EBBID32_32590 [Sphingobium indicum BiD32]